MWTNVKSQSFGDFENNNTCVIIHIAGFKSASFFRICKLIAAEFSWHLKIASVKLILNLVQNAAQF